nr:FISUMP domain-containing protein [Odoribacter splanchnicus]
MKRIGLLFLILGLWITAGWANNVRIEGDVRVKPGDIDPTTGIATIRFTVRWDNSWRDAFNYDGVYLFLKYKVDGEGEQWHHAYLMACDSITDGYEAQMNAAGNNGQENKYEGVFVHRKEKGFGNPVVKMRLKWKITSNAERTLTRDDFVAGNVFLSAMGMEMVYIPRGGFRIGDTKSEMTFKNTDVTIPADKDILSEGKYTYSSSKQTDAKTKGGNPPEFAVNRVNDPGNTPTNAWVGDTKEPDTEYWKVDFDEAKTIRNIAIESVPGGRPNKWALQGQSVEGGTWTTIYTGTKEDWMIGSMRTYPCTHAIELSDTLTAYLHYQIKILQTDSIPVIKNVAMTTENIFKYVDNSVIVAGPQTDMNPRIGLFADDGDKNWTGTTPVFYPNGYAAFWTMKYEISQEQYVTFLNKLTVEQQRVRTIGAAFERLVEGQYVFGPFKTRPSARNGIKLASIGTNGDPHVFANDLDSTNEYGQDGDGQTVACNFLNAGDMLAYADWCGLRPLSEMEFEKMARRPFPEAAIWYEFAWNSNKGNDFATNIQNKGAKTEKPNGNVNAGQQPGVGGPVRCGSFASNSSGQQSSGASFWGVMELSGNLAEVVYNANVEGRNFHADQNVYHGNGTLASNGSTDMSVMEWPVAPNAFGLRGGSYLSDAKQITISDRSKHWGVYASTDETSAVRDSTVTFRLGRTAPVLSVVSELKMMNGKTTAVDEPVDTICSGEGYTLEGVVPAEIDGAYRIAWYVSENQGKLWDLIVGEEEPTLTVSNLRNINEEADFFKEYWYKRMIYSNGVDVVHSHPVKLKVVNHDVKINRYRDTVDIYDHSNGIEVIASQQSTFNWYWIRENSGNRELSVEYPAVVPNLHQINFLKYKDFSDSNKSEFDYDNETNETDREEKVLIETHILGSCTRRDTIDVFIKKSRASLNVLADAEQSLNPDFKCGDVLIDNEQTKGVRYKTVKIGNQCWMAENLRREISGGKYLCYNNDVLNCKRYGYLYNWNAAVGAFTEKIQGICPKGWHIPTYAEWKTLYTVVGEAAKLKSQLGSWGNQVYTAVNMGTNETRFSALPAGAANTPGNASYFARFTGHKYIYEGAWWWTSSSWTGGWGTYYYYSYGDKYGWDSGTQPYNAYLKHGLGWSFGDDKSWFYDSSNRSSDAYGRSTTRFRDEIYMSVRCVRDLPEE